MRMRALLPIVLGVSGCAGAPPAAPAAETTEEQPQSVAKKDEPAEGADPESRSAVAKTDAGAADAAPPYVEPPPQIVRRHHVFGTLKARAAKKVVMTSVLTTAADEAETLAPGTEAVLEFKAKGSKEWLPVADVVVKGVSIKGKRELGNERQEITLEIRTEHSHKALGKRSPFQRNARVRLQVDRMESGAAAPAAPAGPAAEP